MITQPNTQTPSIKRVWSKPKLTIIGGELDDIALFSGMATDGPYAHTS